MLEAIVLIVFRPDIALASYDLRRDSRLRGWLSSSASASRSRCDNAEHRATGTPNSIDV